MNKEAIIKTIKEQHERDLESLLNYLDSVLPDCEHDWTDARNEVIQSGEWCPKCGSVRAT